MGTDFKGGHTLNLHPFARDGVTLLGPLRGATHDKVLLAPALHENLAIVDQFEIEAVKMIDGFVQANGLDTPADDLQNPQKGDNVGFFINLSGQFF